MPRDMTLSTIKVTEEQIIKAFVEIGYSAKYAAEALQSDRFIESLGITIVDKCIFNEVKRVETR
jgi:hypothetical protein